MKTIREELSENRRQYLKRKPLKKQKGAINLIENFIIPKFREINRSMPELERLKIMFCYGYGEYYITTNINQRIKSPYAAKTIEEALKLASKYDINASERDDGSGGSVYEFYIELD